MVFQVTQFNMNLQLEMDLQILQQALVVVQQHTHLDHLQLEHNTTIALLAYQLIQVLIQ